MQFILYFPYYQKNQIEILTFFCVLEIYFRKYLNANSIEENASDTKNESSQREAQQEHKLARKSAGLQCKQIFFFFCLSSNF